ncbi:MAG TPA: GGDEF domain-containing protein [Bryobacteraceae bacterium]|nr:GGDEF domain-containing protein [Bryobacteraceae bacterium]
MVILRLNHTKNDQEVAESAVSAFRASLLAMAACGQRAIPNAGSELCGKLTGIGNSLQGQPDPQTLNEAARRTEQELVAWADWAVRYRDESEREMREIVAAVAQAADAIGKRDERYSRDISQMTGKLRTIAGMNDPSLIRSSLTEAAAALKVCVEKMAEDSRITLQRLNSEVEQCRTRLEESERVSTLDPLTDLANRRGFERRLECCLRAAEPFCLILIDLNGFKTVNDRYGHLAGDDLLKQFALELRAQCAPSDTVARWGGDEFFIIVTGHLSEAGVRVDRIRRWALGEYNLRRAGASGETVKVALSAAISVVEWDGTERARELIARADKSVYEVKRHQLT